MLGFFLLCGIKTFATHLRAGNIIMEQIGDCSDRKYRIRIIVYTNTLNTNVMFGGEQDYLDFGDGSPRVLVPEIKPGDPLGRYSVVDAQRGIARAYYEIEHVYGSIGQYTVSYIEPNRNAGVLNMDNSVNTTFYLETQITIDPTLGCSTPPDLKVPPVDRACKGVIWQHNPGASIPSNGAGDSLSYEMVVPYRDRRTTVVNYRDPNNQQFYSNFSQGNELGNGPPTFSIDAIDGTVTWDSPGAAGEYNIAFIVVEWKKINFQGIRRWVRVGFVRRDMQIIVEDDCSNKRPELEVPEDICVEAGTDIHKQIIGKDPDGDKVRIEAFSDVFEFTPPTNRAIVSPFPAVFQATPAVLNFDWQTSCDHIRERPYQIVFKATDNRNNGNGLVSFKTWRITVVGPAPTWQDATLNTTRKEATIKWDPYICGNASRIQVWRKVDSTSFKPAECQTGMPPGLGYEKIAELAAKTPSGVQVTQYVDNNKGEGLSPGAMYCYRLVAVFPLPGGGESYVSRDTCVGPVPVDVPIITKVSVLKTHTTQGEIRVDWIEPYEANTGTFPPPYEYRVYRAETFARGNDSTLITTTSALTFNDTGLNTEDKVYNYSVAAYSTGNTFVGVSKVASSVRLETKSEVGQIQLLWTASVPWSNQVSKYPYHLIFRGPEGSTDTDLVLIDSVLATVEGLKYTDKGQYQNTPLQEGTVYCYKIETRGSYGNKDPHFPQPIKNFSQKICVQPGDSIPPCKPILTVELNNCDQFRSLSTSCYENTFTNILKWTNDEAPSCQADISGYIIYRSSSTDPNDVELEIATVSSTSTSFIDDNNDLGLPSFAFCYRIAAVDRSGNVSEKSDPVCNDNCPQYVLPNVFTPNADGKNDVFSAFNIRNYVNAECINLETCDIPPDLVEKCARFVKRVNFKVFNRWGQEVYSYQSGSENSIYIDWDGKDSKGVKLAPAVYYYVAEVTFDVLRPEDQVKNFKGWIHLLDSQ